MSFGLTAIGEYSQVLFSSEASNLVFIGKPTFLRRSGYTNPARYFNSSVGTLYNNPIGGFYEYSFNSGGRDCVFFAYTPYPNKCSIAATSKSGGAYSIVVVSQGGVVPTLYGFSISTNSSVIGNGLIVYKSDGGIAFNSQDNILILGGFYYGGVQYSGLHTARIGDMYYVANGGGRYTPDIRYLGSIDPISAVLTKPIVYIAAPQSALHRADAVYSADFYELAGAYNPNTRQMEIEWVNPAGFGSYSYITTVQSPARQAFFMVADGAMYD